MGGFWALLAKKVVEKKVQDKMASVAGTTLGQAAMAGGKGLMDQATQKDETPASPTGMPMPKQMNFYDKQ